MTRLTSIFLPPLRSTPGPGNFCKSTAACLSRDTTKRGKLRTACSSDIHRPSERGQYTFVPRAAGLSLMTPPSMGAETARPCPGPLTALPPVLRDLLTARPLSPQWSSSSSSSLDQVRGQPTGTQRSPQVPHLRGPRTENMAAHASVDPAFSGPPAPNGRHGIPAASEHRSRSLTEAQGWEGPVEPQALVVCGALARGSGVCTLRWSPTGDR